MKATGLTRRAVSLCTIPHGGRFTWSMEKDCGAGTVCMHILPAHAFSGHGDNRYWTPLSGPSAGCLFVGFDTDLVFPQGTPTIAELQPLIAVLFETQEGARSLANAAKHIWNHFNKGTSRT